MDMYLFPGFVTIRRTLVNSLLSSILMIHQMIARVCIAPGRMPLHCQMRHHIACRHQLLSQRELILHRLDQSLCGEVHLRRHLLVYLILCFHLGKEEIHTLLVFLPPLIVLLHGGIHLLQHKQGLL
jgi:hypothetical protein